jgi:hypothetical protein
MGIAHTWETAREEGYLGYQEASPLSEARHKILVFQGTRKD